VRQVEFFVEGTPKPQGSKKTFINHKTGKAVIVEAAGDPLKKWRKRVAEEASVHYFSEPVHSTSEPVHSASEPVHSASEPFTKCVRVSLIFRLKRPKSHYRTGKFSDVLKEEHVATRHGKRPDADKLARAVLDGLTGVVFVDDSQVFDLSVLKTWQKRDEPEGCYIKVTEIQGNG
jgi:Holliday junction resolvase RusA-like endonuclease